MTAEEMVSAACDEIELLRKREDAWKRLVEYLIEESGFAPPIDAEGLWVDLYDEVTMATHRREP